MLVMLMSPFTCSELDLSNVMFPFPSEDVEGLKYNPALEGVLREISLFTVNFTSLPKT